MNQYFLAWIACGGDLHEFPFSRQIARFDLQVKNVLLGNYDALNLGNRNWRPASNNEWNDLALDDPRGGPDFFRIGEPADLITGKAMAFSSLTGGNDKQDIGPIQRIVYLVPPLVAVLD